MAAIAARVVSKEDLRSVRRHSYRRHLQWTYVYATFLLRLLRHGMECSAASP